MKKGIDISHHNIITDLTPYDFVIIRAGYGMNGRDKKFHDHMALASMAGIPIGIYWFIYARNEEESHDNALKCLDVIGQYKNIITLPVYSDFEYDSEKRYPDIKYTGSLRSEIVNAFNDVIKRAGFKWGTYSNVDYLKNKFSSSLEIGSLWLAQWASQYVTDYHPDIWQFTNRLNGENLDGNYLINIGLLACDSDPGDSDLVCICPHCGNSLKLVKA